MEIWGITGLMGTGKSTATQYLAEKGYPVINVDEVTKQVVDRNTELGKEGFAAIYKIFGDEILDRSRNLDRSALRKKMMLNPQDKQRMEEAIDPIVFRHVEKLTMGWSNRGVKYGFLEGSRLAEAGYHNKIKGLIRVTASFDKRVNRMAKRDSMGKEEIGMMFQLQDREELMRRASKIEWKNDGTVKALQTSIDAFCAGTR